MQTSSDTPSDTQIARQQRGAARVFWLWLIVATAMLVTGNVTHAVLHAEAGTVARRPVPLRLLALLAATHSVALLVRSRAGGRTYWCALIMTLALASCAFVLSFDALRSLAVTLGLPEECEVLSAGQIVQHRSAFETAGLSPWLSSDGCPASQGANAPGLDGDGRGRPASMTSASVRSTPAVSRLARWGSRRNGRIDSPSSSLQRLPSTRSTAPECTSPTNTQNNSSHCCANTGQPTPNSSTRHRSPGGGAVLHCTCQPPPWSS
jgi:hypothetical protein